MDPQALESVVLLIGKSIHVVNPLLNEEAQRAIAARIVKTLFQEVPDRDALKDVIVTGYRQIV